jgi:hypothetical protein
MSSEQHDGSLRDPAEVVRRLALNREQRDWINAAAAASNSTPSTTRTPTRCSRRPADYAGVVAAWDVARCEEPV